VISVSNEEDLKLKVGDIDSHGDAVTVVYDRSDNEYIIYSVSSGSLKCGDFGVELQHHSAITSPMMKIGELFAVDPRLARKYDSHRALGIRHWCRGETEAAAQALEATYDLMYRAFTRRARLLYISGSFLVIVLISLVLAATEYLGATTAKTWCLVSLFGSIGAFVSVSTSRQLSSVDVLEEWGAVVLYGIVRATVAVAFAILMYLLVLGGVLLTEIARDSIARLLVVAFAAGFSEKFVPEVVIHQAIGSASHK
jgi:hypothetical protein